MSAVALTLIGGAGNKMFQWAYAKAFAEARNLELRTPEWIGEKVFVLGTFGPIPRPDGTEEFKLSGYFQTQKDIDTYSRSDCRRWFAFQPEVLLQLTTFQAIDMPYAHLRRGDFIKSGYPTISLSSVAAAVKANRGNPDFVPVSDAFPTIDPWFQGDMQCLPDFSRLMSAPVLFRANSSFSYWAGVLSNGDIYSPVIDGLAGGVEHDGVKYVRGNHSRLANLDFTTDLILRES